MSFVNDTSPPNGQKRNWTEDTGQLTVGLIACEVANLLLLFATLWLLLCMIAYGVKTRRWSRRSGRSANVDRGAIYVASLFAVALALPRLSLTEVVFNAPRMPGGLDQCEMLVDASNLANYVTSYSAYFFLWLRQRTIYGHPSSKNFAGKWSNVISYVWLIVLTIFSITVCYVYVVPSLFDASPDGCVLKTMGVNATGIRDPSNSLRDYLLAGALVLSQITLLAMFLYPLAKSGALVSNNSRTVTISTLSHPRPKSAAGKRLTNAKNRLSSVITVFNGPDNGSRVSMLIRRSVIGASVAIVADILVLILAVVFLPSFPVAVAMTAYNAGNFVKIVCIISTFGFYRKIFLLLCRIVRPSNGHGVSWASTEANNRRGRYYDHSVSLEDIPGS